MNTQTPEHFQGFHVPQENAPLHQDQVELLDSLEKVTLKQNHTEQYIGEVSGVDTSSLVTKEMIRPGALLKFVRESAKANGVSEWDVTMKLRLLGVTDTDKIQEIEKKYKETITYVGDVHGGDDELFQRLSNLQENPPEVLIFNGDVIGNDNFSKLQKLFYNHVNNHSRNELLKEKPDASDEEILTYAGTKPPEADFNLKKGFVSLRRYELALGEMSEEAIEVHVASLSDKEIADEIRRYAKFSHYGHYASNLSDASKAGLAHGIEEQAQKLLGPIKALQEKGTKVHIVEGNWDARSPIDFVPNTPDVAPLPEEKRLFRPKNFFENHGVEFNDTLIAVDTDTTLQILLPFDEIIDFKQITNEKIDELKKKIEGAKRARKAVVLVAHGEPDWQIHNLTVENAKPQGEHAQVVAGMNEALHAFLPDEVIYGHMHDVFTNEKREVIDVNSKYFLDVLSDGSSELIQYLKDLKPGHVLSSYIPFRHIAEMKVSKKDKDRNAAMLGGNRQPVRVIKHS